LLTATSSRRLQIDAYTSALLEASIDFVQARLNSGAIVEPSVLDTDAGQYTLSFDDVSHYDAEGLL
jgi:hypothetical protein